MGATPRTPGGCERGNLSLVQRGVSPITLSQSFQQLEVKRAARAKAPAPFSLRLSCDERTQLEAAAGGEPLGAFVRGQLFGGDLVPRRTRGREPVKDHAALAQVLAMLGRSRLASNLNQLAKAAHIGALPLSEELAVQLQEACRGVHDMRAELLRALGTREA